MPHHSQLAASSCNNKICSSPERPALLFSMAAIAAYNCGPSLEDDPIIRNLAESQAKAQGKESQQPPTPKGMSTRIAHPSIPKRSCLKCPKNIDNTASTTASTVASRRIGDDSSNSDHYGPQGGPSREVSFDCIRIQKYPMVLGDNPACTIGAPVTLDWVHEEEEVYDIDVYEAERAGQASKRRTTQLRYLVLSYYRRRDILRQARIRGWRTQINCQTNEQDTTTASSDEYAASPGKAGGGHDIGRAQNQESNNILFIEQERRQFQHQRTTTLLFFLLPHRRCTWVAAVPHGK